MSKQIQEQLKNLKHIEQGFAPDAFWVEKNKQALMTRIESEKKEVMSAQQTWQFFVPAKMLFAARPVATLVIVSILSVVGWTASVSASYQSLPGDLLYNVKIASEKTQIAFAGIVQGPEKKAALLNNAAKTRAYEAKALIAQKKDARLVEETLTDLEETVEQARKTAQTVSEKEPTSAPKLVAELAQSNTVINDTLDDVFNGTDVIESDLAERIVKTTKTVTGKSIEAAQEIVKKQEAGTIGDEQTEEVKKVVTSVIESASRDLEGAAQALEKNKTAAQQVEIAIASSTAGIADTPTTSVATSTPPPSTVSETSSTQPGETTTPSQAAPVTITKPLSATDLTAIPGASVGSLQDVLTLVNEGRLSEALDKVAAVAKEETNQAPIIIEQTPVAAPVTPTPPTATQPVTGTGGAAAGSTGGTQVDTSSTPLPQQQ